jgi:hypothetical protein
MDAGCADALARALTRRPSRWILIWVLGGLAVRGPPALLRVASGADHGELTRSRQQLGIAFEDGSGPAEGIDRLRPRHQAWQTHGGGRRSAKAYLEAMVRLQYNRRQAVCLNHPAKHLVPSESCLQTPMPGLP